MAIARSVDRRLFFLMDRAHAQVGKNADHVLRNAVGFSSAQAAIITYLGYNDGCRLSELADGVGHNRSAITAMTGRMETAKLISRRSVLFDGRGVSVHLTEKGWQARINVMDVMRDFNSALRQGFSDSELDVIFRFLAETERNAEKFTQAQRPKESALDSN
jgi:DNA-binding MarR family transcriptional regulator